MKPGPLGWLADTDHKVTAARVGVTAFAFFLLSGLLALAMRAQLAQPGLDLVSQHAYNELVTMHGSGMVYMVITPAALAFGLYLVPLQVGARNLAFPRVAAFGSWLLLFGGLVMFSSFLTSTGAGDAGWTSFFPLSGSSASPGSGMDLWVIGVGIIGIATTLLAIPVIGTITHRRAPGMTMFRLPILTYTMLVTGLMVLAALPVLSVAMGLLFAQRHLGGVFEGGDGPILYQHLFWFYGHPVVYIMFFPFLGAVAEVVATFSRRRIFGYRTVIFSLLAFTAISMSVWAHHMFTTGGVQNQYFATTSHMLAVPAGLEYFALIGTMIGGVILLRTAMLFALGFILQFLIGGLTGIVVASPPLDYHVHDSFFIVAHFHYTLFAGSLFGLFAGVYYWYPKVTGKLLSERLGKVHFGLLVVGANLTFFPMFISGLKGMPRRVPGYTESLGDLNLLSSIGAAVIALGILAFLANLVHTARHGAAAGADPWGGQTLEWWAASPPPPHNFDSLPPIRSFAPLLDLKESEEGASGPALRLRETQPEAAGP